MFFSSDTIRAAVWYAVRPRLIGAALLALGLGFAFVLAAGLQ
jgi:hypothetical protein